MQALLNKFSPKEKKILIAAAAVVFIAIGDRLIISPVSGKVKEINQEIKMSERQLGRYLRYLNQKDIVRKRYQQYMHYVKKVGSDEEEIANILGEIETLARTSGVYLIDTKPQAPKKVDFYKQYVAEIEAEGQMSALVNFLYQLNTSSQLLRVEKVQFSLKEKETPVVKSEMVITKLVIP